MIEFTQSNRGTSHTVQFDSLNVNDWFVRQGQLFIKMGQFDAWKVVTGGFVRFDMTTLVNTTDVKVHYEL